MIGIKNIITLANYISIPSPCFVIEEALLEKNLTKIASVKNGAGITILGALKAFSNYSTFPLVLNYLDGFTASSLNEAKLCFEEGKEKAHLCCPVYLEKELEAMLPISSHITFNSLSQYERFRGKAKDLKIGIRLNPEYSEVGTAIYNPCAYDSRLGVTLKELPSELNEDVTGLHFHMLCENNSFTFERCLASIVEKFDSYLKKVLWVNFGGGHLITHKEYDVNHMIGVLTKFKEKYPNLEVIIEPGSAMAWKTGFLKTTVEDILVKGDVTVLMIDASISNHLPDCLEMPYQPEIRGTEFYDKHEGQKYKIGGMTCLAGDFLGNYSFDVAPKVGDELIFEDMIHYTTVKTNTFNGVNLPSIGIIKSSGEFQLLKSFGYEDFKSRL